MLELRPNCECCDKDLPARFGRGADVLLRVHVLQRLRRSGLGGRCPNCGGELVRRPVRPAEKLAKFPASTTRKVKAEGCVKAA